MREKKRKKRGKKEGKGVEREEGGRGISNYRTEKWTRIKHVDKDKLAGVQRAGKIKTRTTSQRLEIKNMEGAMV